MTSLVGVAVSCEHAPSLRSPLDSVEAGDLPSDAVMLSAPSTVLCPPPTSHAATHIPLASRRLLLLHLQIRHYSLHAPCPVIRDR